MNPWLNPQPYTVAYTTAGERQNHHFNADVSSLLAWLIAHPSVDVSLYCKDAYMFSVGLFSAWLAGKKVHLPSDEITLNKLSNPVILTDFKHLGTSIEAIINTSHAPPVTTAPSPASQLIIYTSGSTGEPKPVLKTYKQLLIEIQSLEALFGKTIQDSIIVSTVSHQHLYGLLFRVLWPLLSGRAFESETAFFPEQWTEKTRKHKRVTFVASPAHYKRFCTQMPWQELAPHISMMFSSAGLLAADTATELKKSTGIAITEIFGSTETGGVAWRRAPQFWQAMPNILLRANNSNALEICSPHLGHNNWYTMDDGVVFDEIGHFMLTGRLDRIVKVEEKRVALATVESELRALLSIEDAFVQFQTQNNRQFLRAYVVLNSISRDELLRLGKHKFIQILKQQLQGIIDPLAIPRQWRFIDALPTDAQGKVVPRLLQPEFDATILLPTIINIDIYEQKCIFTLHALAETAYFGGHFPEHPILPGVTQIHWAVQLARSHYVLPSVFLKMEAVKFQRIIVPDSIIKLDLEWDPIKQRLYFAFYSEAGAHSSGRITFQS